MGFRLRKDKVNVSVVVLGVLIPVIIFMIVNSIYQKIYNNKLHETLINSITEAGILYGEENIYLIEENNGVYISVDDLIKQGYFIGNSIDETQLIDNYTKKSFQGLVYVYLKNDAIKAEYMYDKSVSQGSEEEIDIILEVLDYTTNKIIVKVTEVENASYEFIINDSNPINNGNNNIYTFENLYTGIYDIKVNVITEKEVYDLSTVISTKQLEQATYEYNKKDNKITINYPSGNEYKYYYSLDGNTWIEVIENVFTYEVTGKDNLEIVAKVSDGINEKKSPIYTIDVEKEEVEIEQVKHTVTFYLNGGIGSFPTQTVSNGTMAVKPIIKPVKEGYTFDGWYYNNEPFNFNTPITNNIILTAKYSKKEVIKYTIKFDLNGGSGVISNQYIEKNGKVMIPTTPKKEGYKFIGWYQDDALYDFDKQVISNITLTAHWQKIEKPIPSYIVSFDSNGGTNVPNQKVISGSYIIKPTNPTRDGYTFKGWYYNNELYNFNSKITNNITLVAKWEKDNVEKIYNIVFDSNGGTTVENQQVKNGQTVKEPTSPTRNGYTFKGWYLGGIKYNFNTKVTTDMILIAKWQKDAVTVKHTVTFDSNGGSKVVKQSVTEGATATKPKNPTRSGYEFKGWYYNGLLYDFNSKVTKSITLEAKWEKEEITYYTVIFDSNGGSSVDKQLIASGSKVTKPSSPTKKGYEFIGWYYNNKLYNFNSKVTANIILKAKWEKEEVTYYTVTFDTDGGSSVNKQTIVSGGKVTKPSSPTKVGYEFKGWYYNGKSYNFNSKVTKDMTLTAKWEEEQTTTYYTVTFDTDGGSSVNKQSIESGKVATKPANPMKIGYEFKGWYYNNQLYNFNSQVTKNITLIAKWEKIEVEIPTVKYTNANKKGTWIFINNPEYLGFSGGNNGKGYLADSTGANQLVYRQVLSSGNAEIYYEHAIGNGIEIKDGENGTYYALRFYNPNKETVTLTINKCGSKTGWNGDDVFIQYYKTCPIKGNYTIGPQETLYIYHDGKYGINKLVVGDITKHSTITSLPKAQPFEGVLNITTSNQLTFMVLSYKDIYKTGSAVYDGNFTDTYSTLLYTGYYNTLPYVQNNLKVSIDDDTKKGNLSVKYIDTTGKEVISDKWITNNIGAGYRTQEFGGRVGSDTINLIVPIKNGSFTIGNFPTYKDTRKNLTWTNVNGTSKIDNWCYNWANWGVHYIEKITLTNNSNTNKTVSFYVDDQNIAKRMIINYNGTTKYLNGKGNRQKVWTQTLKPGETKTISAEITLGGYSSADIAKYLVLE